MFVGSGESSLTISPNPSPITSPRMMAMGKSSLRVL
jgi:hypothetical protein